MYVQKAYIQTNTLKIQLYLTFLVFATYYTISDSRSKASIAFNLMRIIIFYIIQVFIIFSCKKNEENVFGFNYTPYRNHIPAIYAKILSHIFITGTSYTQGYSLLFYINYDRKFTHSCTQYYRYTENKIKSLQSFLHIIIAYFKFS